MAVNQEWLERRRAEIDLAKQWEEQRQQERAQREAEHAELYQKAMERREARARGEVVEMPHVPTINEVLAASQAEREAAAQQAEAERLAAISPREAAISALPLPTQEFIRKYEQIRHQPYPLEALGIHLPANEA